MGDSDDELPSFQQLQYERRNKEQVLASNNVEAKRQLVTEVSSKSKGGRERRHDPNKVLKIQAELVTSKANRRWKSKQNTSSDDDLEAIDYSHNMMQVDLSIPVTIRSNNFRLTDAMTTVSGWELPNQSMCTRSRKNSKTNANVMSGPPQPEMLDNRRPRTRRQRYPRRVVSSTVTSGSVLENSIIDLSDSLSEEVVPVTNDCSIIDLTNISAPTPICSEVIAIDELGSPSAKAMNCPICYENLRGRPTCATVCGHVFCKSCIERSLSTMKFCPQCRARLTKKKIHPLFLPA